MAKVKDSFLFHFDDLEILEDMSDVEVGQIFRDVIRYAQDGTEPEYDDRFMKNCFRMIARRHDSDSKAYEEKCRKNAENGSKGGRPRNGQLITMTGKVVPDGEVEGKHFLYLLQDITTGEYKIGETANLMQRRYDIKRPTNNLKVVDYIIDTTLYCQRSEREILKRYRDKSTGGDWLKNDSEMANQILSEWFSKKPNGFSEKREDAKKADMDKDIDSDIDIDMESDSDIDRLPADVREVPTAFIADIKKRVIEDSDASTLAENTWIRPAKIKQDSKNIYITMAQEQAVKHIKSTYGEFFLSAIRAVNPEFQGDVIFATG